MVAQLLRLRADLLAGEVRGGVGRSVLVVLLSVAALTAAVLAAAALAGLRTADPETARAVAVPVGSLLALGATVLPLALGVGDQLDPRRFAAFGLGRKDLAVGIGVAGLVGVPVVAVAIVAVGQSVTWMRGGGAGVVGVVGAVVAVATCALLARVCSTLGAWRFGSHRARDAAGLVVLVVVVLGIPAAALLLGAGWPDPTGAGMRRVAEVAGWTPWGAAWAAPADVAAGHVGRGLAELVVALVVVGLLGLAWWALVGRLLVTVDGGPRGTMTRDLGWFDRLGATPVGAVAARAMTYWGRDPRYRMSYLIVVFVPIVVIPLGVAGVPWHWTALVPLPIMALVAGFLPHNDVSYDNTAVWLHVASGAPGWSDRLGRVTPVLVVGIPAVAAGSALSAWLYGDWSAFPVLAGVSASALFAGLGLSSVVSVLLPYPAVRPGDHPFRQPQAPGVVSTVAQSCMVVGIVLFSVPAGWLGVLALTEGPERWAALSFWVGLAIGAVVLAGGVLLGGRLFDRHGPDLLAAAQRN